MAVRKVMVLACSGMTTGELTMALDFTARCTSPLEVHAVVPPSLVTHARGWGVTVHTFPALNALLAYRKVRSITDALAPDIVVLADLNLFLGMSPEFGDKFSTLLPHLASRARVVALDLYGFEETAALLDICGVARFPIVPGVPREVGRLLPVPTHRPGPSTDGRGRYAMLPDHGPLDDGTREATRGLLGVRHDEKLVVITTSTWQHRLASQPLSRLVATYFPDVVFRLLDTAAQRAGPVVVVHVGPQPLDTPRMVATRYVHAPTLVRDEFLRTLGSADVHVSTNVPSTTAVRAASLRVPVVNIVAGPELPRVRRSRHDAVEEYVERVGKGFPFMMWPLGMYGALAHVMAGNPFAATQQTCDVAHPYDVVETLVAHLAGGPDRRALRAAQKRYFRDHVAVLDSEETALEAALAHRG